MHLNVHLKGCCAKQTPSKEVVLRLELEAMALRTMTGGTKESAAPEKGL